MNISSILLFLVLFFQSTEFIKDWVYTVNALWWHWKNEKSDSYLQRWEFGENIQSTPSMTTPLYKTWERQIGVKTTGLVLIYGRGVNYTRPSRMGRNILAGGSITNLGLALSILHSGDSRKVPALGMCSNQRAVRGWRVYDQFDQDWNDR